MQLPDDPVIYIAGPMTGLPHFNFPAFATAAIHLRAEGYKVVNPAELSGDTDKPWEHYMRISLKAMLDCNTIYLLEGWRRSRGARIEYNLARDLNFFLMSE